MAKVGRKSTRCGTGRRSRTPKTSASISSVSSNASGLSSRRRSSNSKLFAPRSRSSLKNPLPVALNIVMKVQEKKNKEFSMKPVSISVNDVNFWQNVQQRQQQQPSKESSKTKAAFRQKQKLDPRTAKKRGYEADYEELSDSVFEHDTPATKKKNVQTQTSETEASAKPKQNLFQQLQKVATEISLSKTKNNLAVAEEDSQTHLAVAVEEARSPSNSQTLSAGKKKKKIEVIGNRYKNKISLFRFRSMQKPRSNNAGAPLKFGRRLPRPRTISFSDCDDSFARGGKSSAAGRTFPLDKEFRNSLGFTALEYAGIKSPNQSLSLSQIEQIYAENRTSTPKDKTKAGASILVDTVSVDAKSDGRNSLKSNTSMSSGSNNPVNVVENNRPIITETPPKAAAPILINTFSDDKNDRRDSVASDTSMCFDQCNRLDVPCDIEVIQGDDATEMYDHLREMRIGFIANGVHMALNLKLNIRSDEEILYLEPVELLYEGNKMWRRSARQVAKEIEGKRLADQKKMDTFNLSDAQMNKQNARRLTTDERFVSASTGVTPKMNKQASPKIKSILKNPTRAVVDAGKAGPSSSKADAKKIPRCETCRNKFCS